MESEAAEQVEQAKSEFGRGLIVCLAKFSAHIENYWYVRIVHCERWRQMSAKDRAHFMNEAARYPRGDSAKMIADVSTSMNESDAGVSHAIELWMNAASDHFYDLDRDAAPQVLCELADMCLKIGHGFTGKKWTWETVETINRLWRESCLAIDANMKVVADWGQY